MGPDLHTFSKPVFLHNVHTNNAPQKCAKATTKVQMWKTNSWGQRSRTFHKGFDSNIRTALCQLSWKVENRKGWKFFLRKFDQMSLVKLRFTIHTTK